MLVSTPPKPFNTHRNKTCESSMSPKYNHHRSLFTPKSKGPPICDPPSPLRNRPLFSLSTNIPGSDDMVQSPFKSLPLVPPHNAFFTIQPQTIPADDQEGNIFLSTAAPVAQEPLTPLKQPRRVPSSAVFSARQQNTVAPLAGGGSKAVSRGAVGTKRKSTTSSTPLRLTPLRASPSAKLNDSGISFDRLAPLSSPKFGANTPQSKAETDAHLCRQTDTLTRLRLSDPEVIDFDEAANDSGCEMDEGSAYRSPTTRKQPKSLIIATVHAAKADEEVAEAISPGGHVAKRRARSRPVSSELLEGVLKSTKNSPLKPIKPSGIPCRIGGTRPRHGATVTFPSLTHRGRASPASTSCEAGSPRRRRRISRPEPLPPLLPRAPLNRIESNSSATLFFGPSIPRPSPAKPRSRTSSHFSSSTPDPSTRNLAARPVWSNRHSYAGPTTDSNTWNTFQMRNTSPSPGTSPDKTSRDNSMEDEDMFFAGEESSFVLNVINDTPSPPKVALLKKFKPNDSGVNDEDEMPSLISFPRDSNSVSSFSDDGLVTPICGSELASGWPIAPTFVAGADPYMEQGIDIDEFIQKTLADASKGSNMPKKAPGTPVKKTRISYFGHERPWQSAVASKVGLKDDVEFKKVPRKSLPAVFPPMGGATTRANKSSIDWQPTDTEDDEEYSPSMRRDRYPGLGLGQPQTTQLTGKPDVSLMWSRWPGIIRRSSSGAFSSGSESASLANTPTRAKGTDWQLPKPRIPLRFSPSSDAVGKAFRSTSGSSNSSMISSPTTNRTKAVTNADSSTTTGTQAGRHARLARPSVTSLRRLSDIGMEEEKPGRFKRDFDEVEEIGSGEFGKVMKVKSKNGSDGVFSAVKHSKRFEGAKHRLRLREEVDILKHLSEAALSHSYADGRHPNVLGYIDSWEENEALYIRTELCEYGSLARFLWEYGRVFPRLDEARVWKIMADLSSGLRFIHGTGVIHLDLKPSNVFVTKEGRFKIGDFGMASLWPRDPAQNATSDEGMRSASESGRFASLPTRGCHAEATHTMTTGGFEREGDKLYLAPEVLQGCYSKAADVFSLGMTILETASNIVVPDQGEAWHRLRNEDFSQVDLQPHSHALVELVRQMMRTDPTQRLTSAEVESYSPVSRARARMETLRLELSAQRKNIWGASPLASVPPGFLEEILGTDLMDTSG